MHQSHTHIPRSVKNILSMSVLCTVVLLSPLQFHTQTQFQLTIAHADPSTPTTPASPQSSAPATPQKTGQDPTKDLACSSSDVSLCISDLVYYIAVALPAWFLGVGAVFMGALIKLTLASTTYAINFIATGWSVTRDIADISFIFILIYLAFTIMLRAETGGTLATLGLVIVAALVVNFSFLISRAVIDVGNIAAVEIYNVIPATTPSSAQTQAGVTTGGILANIGAKDLSAPIMNALDVQGIFKGSGNFAQWYQGKDFLTVVITLSCIYIAMGIIMITLAFGFLAAGVQFLMRIASLWFAIIFSPLAFVAWALRSQAPTLGNLYKRWQTMLVYNSIYPAVFLFVFLFLIIFMKGLSTIGGGPGGVIQSMFSNGPNSNNGAAVGGFSSFLYGLISPIATIAIELGFVIVILRFAFSISDKMGLYGASASHKFSGWVGGKVAGGIGFAGRQTFGRGAYYGSRSEGFRNLASRNALARTLWRGTNTLAGGTYDVRGAGLGIGRTLKAAAGAASTKDIGKAADAKKVSVPARIETRSKQVQAIAKGLQDSEHDKARRAQTFEQGEGVSIQEARRNATEKRNNAQIQFNQASTKAAEAESKANAEKATPGDKIALAEARAAKTMAQTQLTAAQNDVQRLKAAQDDIDRKKENRERQERFGHEMRTSRFPTNIIPGAGSVLAAEKIIQQAQGKTAKEQFIDASKKFAKEESGEEGGDENPPEGPGGGRGGTSGSGGSTSATGATHGGSGAGSGTSSEQINRAMLQALQHIERSTEWTAKSQKRLFNAFARSQEAAHSNSIASVLQKMKSTAANTNEKSANENSPAEHGNTQAAA